MARLILKPISAVPFIVEGKLLHVTSSFGLVTSTADDSFILDKLLSSAGKALYLVKQNGKNRVQVYKR